MSKLSKVVIHFSRIKRDFCGIVQSRAPRIHKSNPLPNFRFECLNRNRRKAQPHSKNLESQSFSELVDEFTATSVEFLRSNCVERGLKVKLLETVKSSSLWWVWMEETEILRPESFISSTTKYRHSSEEASKEIHLADHEEDKSGVRVYLPILVFISFCEIDIIYFAKSSLTLWCVLRGEVALLGNKSILGFGNRKRCGGRSCRILAWEGLRFYRALERISNVNKRFDLFMK